MAAERYTSAMFQGALGNHNRTSRPLRVLLVGSGNQWELAQSYQRAFSALGHEAEVFDWYGRTIDWAARTPGRASRLLLLAVARRRAAIALVAFVRRRRPDILLLIKADDVPRGTIELLRRAAPDCTIACFHPDDPFNIHRFRGPSHPRARYVMRAVDHFFIWSDHLVDRLRASGAREVSYLGFACDPDFTRPLDVASDEGTRFHADVAFVGTWDTKREAWLAPLAHARDISLAIWGTDYWRRRTHDDRVRACWRGTTADGDDFVRAVRSSTAAINVLRPQNETAENMRTYEIPACGGIMLAEWSEQQARVFAPGSEAAYARTPEELLGEVRRLRRESEQGLERIRTAALARARQHTYRHRAEQVVTTLAATRRRLGALDSW